jgi:hypothetical protein
MQVRQELIFGVLIANFPALVLNEQVLLFRMVSCIIVFRVSRACKTGNACNKLPIDEQYNIITDWRSKTT